MNASDRVILIVEDDANDLFFLKRAFGIAHVVNELRHVENGQQAIDYLQGVGPFFDRIAYPLPSLVLLDLKLPLKHGFEVLAWIRQQPLLRNIIVIILTSSSEEKDVSKAYDLGANAFLVKPTSAEKLTEIVRALDMFWFRHNRFWSLP
jgi:CheY-like chemotaxis protein